MHTFKNTIKYILKITINWIWKYIFLSHMPKFNCIRTTKELSQYYFHKQQLSFYKICIIYQNFMRYYIFFFSSKYVQNLSTIAAHRWQFFHKIKFSKSSVTLPSPVKCQLIRHVWSIILFNVGYFVKWGSKNR